MMIGRYEQLDIDTKDICLLCLESRIDTNCYGVSPTLPSLQGLKHLLRYLKVSPKELFNCSSEFLQSMEIREDIDLKISLCSGCSSVTEKFNKLYQDYELIQLQFSGCVQSLHESMSKGNENPERVRKYKDQMRPTKSADLVNASIAANLRNETLKKCSLKLQSVTPRVRVTPEKADVETCSQLPKVNDDVRSKTQIPDPEDIFSRKTRRTRPHKKYAIKSQFHAEYEKLNVSQPESELPLISGIEVIAEVKPVKRIMSKNKSYFSSIRNKLKTKSSHPAPAAASTMSTFSNNVTDTRFGSRKLINCEYCAMKYTTKSLRTHIPLVHPELSIIKFLPSNVSLELCKQGVHNVWKQMIEVSGSKCQMCKTDLGNIYDLKCHYIESHAEELAAKVLENIQSLPESDGVMQNDTESDDGNSTIKRGSFKTRFACEYCGSFYLSRSSLKKHSLYAHPEHIIYKLFPPHISLESCKQGVDGVMKQMLQQTSENGYKCQFCHNIATQKNNLKLHVVSMHAEEFAVEAQKYIGLFPEHLEVESTGDFSTLGNYEYENERINSPSKDIDGSYQTSMALEMDFEEESLVKIENPVSEKVEVDPLDVDYLD